MPNVNAPRGFHPTRTVASAYYNGGDTPYRIASGYNQNIFPGDAVKLLTTGYIVKANPGDQIRGVLVGINWTQGSGVPGTQRYWPANMLTIAGQDAEALVSDDPNMLFEAIFTNSASVPTVADIGATFNLFDAGGNVANGLSGQGVDYSTGSAGAAQFRFVDFLKRADNDTASAYSHGLFMPALHDYRVNTGV